MLSGLKIVAQENVERFPIIQGSYEEQPHLDDAALSVYSHSFAERPSPSCLKT